MTETQNPPPPGPTTGSATGTATGPATGVDREHLLSYERLTRSTTDRKVAGVAGGLGRHLNLDPTLLRVLFVVLSFFGGAGLLLYGVAWLLVPEDGATSGAIPTSPATRNGLLIAAGVLSLLVLLGHSWGGFGLPWPAVVVGLGVVVYLLLVDQRAGRTGQPGGHAPAPADGGPTPPRTAAPPAPAPRRRPRKRGPLLLGPTLALVALALGALGLYDAAGGAVLDTAYPALALAVVGAVLVVGAFVGRAGGLILLGLVAALALAVTSALGGFRGVDFRGGSERLIAPTAAAALHPSYDLSSGRAVVNLSDIGDSDALDGRTIRLDGRAGDLTVVLPPGVQSDVTARIAGPGQVDLPDRSSGGFDTFLSGLYGTGDAAVTIDARLSAGHIYVRNAR